MEKQITIIIPTYNMEAYIGKCLDSLLIPEFDQVEVLVVNDGSKDRSSEIAHSYADRYPDSIRVIDKPNGNYGSCINAALPQATGRYVKVLDADDTFDTVAFSEFVRRIPSKDADLLITDMVVVENEDRIIRDGTLRSNISLRKEWIYKFEDILNTLYSLGMHSLTYNRRVFNNINYKQSEGLSYTDNEWTFLPLAMCRNAVYIDCGYLYLYFLGREGQTMDPKVYNKSVSQMYLIYKSMLKTYEKWKDIVTPSSRRFLNDKLINNIYYTYVRVMNMHDEEASNSLRLFDNELKKVSYDMYVQLGQRNINDHTNYSYVNELRKVDFSYTYRLPFIIRIKSVFTRLLYRKF